MRFFSSILRKWLAPVVGACLVPTLGFAQASKPQYTSLLDCRTVNRLKLPNRVVDAGVFRCKGAGGYAVYVVEDDPRSFLVLERGKKLFSLEKPMVETFTLGDFPNVSGTAKAEWRVDASGKPVALIVRVAYRKPDNGKAASTLLVFDLRGDAPALVGSAATNEDARSLADAAPAQADEEALSRACNAIYVFDPGV